MRQLGLVVLLAGVSLLAPAQDASPQSQAKADAALPMYDVSVIRPAAGLENGDRHVWTRLNTLDVKNMPLLNLLQSAFDVPRDMIIGLPEWAKHERLDIEAKTLDPDTAGLRELTAVQRRAMLQALFKDRLGLQWHYETRVLSAYDLLVANGGSKLKPTVETGHNGGASVNDTRFRLTNVAVSDLAVVLSDKLGRPVVDKTGLTGRYDAVMEWTADTAVLSGDADAPPPLFTALQEQLGLKLVGAKDPVQVCVIDRLVAPVGN